ncbi:zinc-dependent metalloprotease [Flavobacterium sp.]|uniref:zinc-dependent metalloprotease n=1 Tax=Flavobacterium sp. TaxID=239 RepID=UPI0033404757
MKIKLILAFFIFKLGFAQHRTCGMEQQMQRIMADPQLKEQYLDLQQQFENELQRLSNSNESKSTAATIRIPVAVHYPSVVASATNASLRSCLILLAQKQVAILNADYNATNSDLSNWVNDQDFYPDTNYGNMNVVFEIATLNHPTGTGLGFPTNGNPAITFGTDFLSNADTDSTWAGYCNLVVRNLTSGILGYSPLGGSPSSGMTVVIDNNSFSTSLSGSPSACLGYVPSPPFNLGRTLTHELGHFFNLDHTFKACDGSNCATSGDKVCDTPSADTPYYNCDPSGSVSTNCGTTQLTMNYMDYVEDSCMYMFTQGQVNRMTAWSNIIGSQLNMNTLANNEFINTNFSIVPNPSKGIFSIQLKEQIGNYSVSIIDSLGREIYNMDFNQNSDLIQSIQIDNALSGLYFVTIKSNGATLTKKILVK